MTPGQAFPGMPDVERREAQASFAAAVIQLGETGFWRVRAEDEWESIAKEKLLDVPWRQRVWDYMLGRIPDWQHLARPVAWGGYDGRGGMAVTIEEPGELRIKWALVKRLW